MRALNGDQLLAIGRKERGNEMIAWRHQAPWHFAKRVKRLARGHVPDPELTAAHDVGNARAVGRNSEPRHPAPGVLHLAVQVVDYLARLKIKDGNALPRADRQPASVGGDRRVRHVVGVAEADAAEAVQEAVRQRIAETINALTTDLHEGV